MQTKCKLNNTELFSAESVPYSEQRNWKQQVPKKQKNLKKGKVRLNFGVRKEMEDSRLNAIKQLITLVKGQLNFRFSPGVLVHKGITIVLCL